MVNFSFLRVYRSEWHGDHTKPTFIHNINVAKSKNQSVGGSNPSIAKQNKSTKTQKREGNPMSENFIQKAKKWAVGVTVAAMLEVSGEFSTRSYIPLN